MWLADASRMEAWDRTAWLAYHVPFTGGKGTWHDYNPLRLAKRRNANTRLGSDLDAVRPRMPTTLTEDEIALRWRAFKKERADGNGG